MKVQQVYNILNSTLNDVIGKPNYLGSDGVRYPDTTQRFDSAGNPITYGEASWTLNQDLSNVVDMGKLVFDAEAVDNYVQKLIDHIGRVIFVDRTYSPIVPRVMKTSWEYGSVVEKIDCDMPDSEVNPQWKLVDGKTYNQDTFKAPKNVRARFFNDGVTYQIEMSFTEEQIKESFTNATQLNSFFSMVETKISNKTNIDMANLTRATINTMIAGTVYADFYDKLDEKTHTYNLGNNSKTRCINLLGLYKEENPDNLSEEELNLITAQNCIKNLSFIKFASYQMLLVSKHLADISTLFNVGGRERFTPVELQHLVLLSDFKEAADIYLQSVTFHNEFTKLPQSESINFWQGTGKEYKYESTSRIHITSKVTKDNGTSWEEKETIITGVLGVLFDNDALGINNERQKVTSHYNANGDFIQKYYKNFSRHFNDFDENCIVFVVY